MKCVLCGKEAEYTTFWDAPSPLCRECAEIESRKLYETLQNDYYDFSNFYDRIPKEYNYSIFASTLNLNTHEVK